MDFPVNKQLAMKAIQVRTVNEENQEHQAYQDRIQKIDLEIVV